MRHLLYPALTAVSEWQLQLSQINKGDKGISKSTSEKQNLQN